MAYSIFDEIKKTLLGQAAVQPTTDPVTGLIAPGQKPTSGLLGEGGLLFGKGASNIIQDPKFIESLGYLASGLQGDDPFKAMQKAELIKQSKAKTKKAQALEKLLSSTELSERDKLYIAAGLTPPRATTPTLSQETLAVYQKMKGLQGDDFTKAFNSLSKAEQDLYKNKIQPQLDFLSQVSELGAKKTSNVIKLTEKPDQKNLIKNQAYEINGVIYIWDGKTFVKK